MIASFHNGSNNPAFHIRADGEFYSDASSAASTFDEYCDSQAVRALAHVFDKKDNPNKGFVECRWDKFVRYNECNLVDMGILASPVTRLNEHGGHGMLNVPGLQRLHNGAIWQLYTQIQDQAEELAALKGQINALQEGK